MSNVDQGCGPGINVKPSTEDLLSPKNNRISAESCVRRASPSGRLSRTSVPADGIRSAAGAILGDPEMQHSPTAFVKWTANKPGESSFRCLASVIRAALMSLGAKQGNKRKTRLSFSLCPPLCPPCPNPLCRPAGEGRPAAKAKGCWENVVACQAGTVATEVVQSWCSAKGYNSALKP